MSASGPSGSLVFCSDYSRIVINCNMILFGLLERRNMLVSWSNGKLKQGLTVSFFS